MTPATNSAPPAIGLAHPAPFPASGKSSVPIKIVHVLHSFEVGGLENGVVNLMNNLDGERYAHVVCCITRSGRLAGRLTRQNIQIIEMGKKEGSNFALPFRLARLFSKLRPQIVHTRNWGALDGIAGAWLAGVPTMVHSEHGLTMSEVNQNNRRRLLVRRALLSLVDHIVIVSGAQRPWLEQTIGIPRRKITRICNGVSLDRFSSGRSREKARADLHLQRTDFVIGTVGRLDPIKDQGSLIRALSALAASYPHTRLLIAGSGPSRGELGELTSRLGLTDKVHFLGERDDIPGLLPSMDVFVLPSLSEGISNTILEAMASGLPVLATAVGGNTELIVDGETGILIPKQDLGALTRALEIYLNNPPLAVCHGKAGQLRAREHFSLAKMVSAYDFLYSSLALGKTRLLRSAL